MQFDVNYYSLVDRNGFSAKQSLVMKNIMIIRNCKKSCENNKNILLDKPTLNLFAGGQG